MQIKTASVISTGLHVVVLAWATLSFSSKPFETTPAESLPVDIVSETEFSKLTKGIKDAPKPVETPKPVVEKKAEEPPKPVEEIKPKIDEKREVAPNKEAKQEAPPPDPIADKLNKPPEKPPEKMADAKPAPLPPRKPPLPKPPQKQPEFNPDKIAALLDKRDPTRKSLTGAEMNSAPSLGTASGAAAQLSQSEIDALRARLYALWNPPAGAQDASQVQIMIRIRFKRDGTLAAGPQVITSGSGPVFNAMRDSAVRAVLVGQPYTMLRPEHYETWQEIDFVFDSSKMFSDIPVRR
ncbi:MAG: cell envelope biogenesis protein TolA [Pseudolabrys sp.]|nr:cell envelope biogenesis protein TolA [Pseudolabrys sp.]